MKDNTAKRAPLGNNRSISRHIAAKTRAEYYPGRRKITVKVVAEPDLGNAICGRIIGGGEVTQRINLISIAKQKQMCVSELSKADTCYTPGVCSPWKPVVLAAETRFSRKCEDNLYPFISPLARVAKEG